MNWKQIVTNLLLAVWSRIGFWIAGGLSGYGMAEADIRAVVGGAGVLVSWFLMRFWMGEEK